MTKEELLYQMDVLVHEFVCDNMMAGEDYVALKEHARMVLLKNLLQP